PSYRTAAIEKGDLEQTVTATGTLSAVKTVNVGTQVSGQVSALYADFNDQVKKGQRLARIDPTLAEQSVRDAEAGLDRARAQLQQSQQDYERNRALENDGLIAKSSFDSSSANLAVAKANLESAQVSLDRARRNLSYTEIYAPIDGVVVERNVDVGQTVAASLSAPQLFLIANDLAHMQILASVDESDISQIKEGQKVRFTVQSMPNEKFEGKVRQVRLQSTVQENVVNYTVPIDVENPDGKLLPGMTANIDFLVNSVSDVLKVPNAALRFRPSEDVIAKIREERKKAAAAAGGAATSSDAATGTGNGTARGGNGAPGNGSGRRWNGGNRPADFGMLWIVDPGGKISMAPARTGVSDGTATEVRGRNIKEGMQVIVGMGAQSQSASTETSGPFTQQRSQRHGPPGAF
ncbi:MAG: efflux RND transporter periplasmic adaptor subunit, partial [Thermoanaerobaculia bacterium]